MATAGSTGVITRRRWEFARSVARSDWAAVLQDAIAAAIKHAEAVEGLELEFDRNALKAATEAIEQGREVGIEW